MKTLVVFGFAFLVLFSLPKPSEAQEESPQEPPASSYELLLDVEEQLMGEEYEEARELMSKFLAGTLTQQEAERLKELADERPSGFMFMLHRRDMIAIHTLLTELLAGQIMHI